MSEPRPHAAEPLFRPRVLIVDSDPTEAGRLLRFIEGEGMEVVRATSAEAGVNVLDDTAVDAVISELRAPEVDGLRLLRVALRRNPEACVLFAVDPADVTLAVRALEAGAWDFQVRPILAEKILAALRRARRLQTLVGEVEELRRRLDRKYGLSNIIGNSAAISAVKAKILQVAPTDATVLILGETGTGKELVGTAIHQNSSRRNEALIKLHCGDLADGLIESELFGHEKGAFTGAVSARKGRFELADGGTLFLDEVSDLSPGTQVKLLRVLQEREFLRVGGNRSVKVDVRLIAATNRDLKDLVAHGNFRRDLFYRLNVVLIEMPALRHRPQDIPLLVERFLSEAVEAYGKETPGVAPAVMDRLVRHSWPGNVRELKNVITTMVISAEGEQPLGVESLPPSFPVPPVGWKNISIPINSKLIDVEKRLIEAHLIQEGEDVRRVAGTLGISLRTLYRRISEYNIRK